jgi:adenosylmethionine-8-amino-7-oxononanoate aminotransferase
MIWAFDVTDATPGFAARFHQAALAQGLFIRPIGNTVYVMPPYILSADETMAMGERIQQVVEDVLHAQKP